METTTEFFVIWANTDLGANVIGGVATAVFFGIFAWLWRQYREHRVKQLGDLMEEIIKHRNRGSQPVSDPVAWIKKAQELEIEALKKASKVSKASKILINHLGELHDYDISPQVDDPKQIHFVNLLTTVISRIRDILERHDK